MMMYRLAVLSVLFSGLAHAEQPIFGEMPRWDGGYGVQVIQLYRDQEIRDGAQGTTFDRSVHFTRIDGVYTWDKSIRVTGKLRLIDAATQSGASRDDLVGLSALTLALPLKEYFNLDGRSGSFTIAPQIFIPFKGADMGLSHPFYQAERAGASIGYETESYHYHFGSSISVWKVYSDSTPLYSAAISAGLNGFVVGFNGHLKLGLDAHRFPSGRSNVHAGPTVYGMISDEWHWQFRSHYTVSALQNRSTQKRDLIVGLGLGWVR